jgi:hypothetical protein
MQSRIQSFVESVANVVIGFIVALAAQLVIFPVFNIKVTLSENMAIGAFFTAISIIRSYVVRRAFNRIHRVF